MQIYKNLFKSTSIRIWLILWEAAVIISNSNTCCFCYCEPLFSVFQFIHFLPKLYKFKNNARSDLIITKCRSWTSFSFSLLSRQPIAAFSGFYYFSQFFPLSDLIYPQSLIFWFFRIYFSPLGLEPATSVCESRSLTTAPRWFWFSDFKGFLMIKAALSFWSV